MRFAIIMHMPTRVSGTIYGHNGNLKDVLVALNEDGRSSVFTLGRTQAIKITNREWGFDWEKSGTNVVVKLDGKLVSGKKSNAVGEHTMRAYVLNYGETLAIWTPALPRQAIK